MKVYVVPGSPNCVAKLAATKGSPWLVEWRASDESERRARGRATRARADLALVTVLVFNMGSTLGVFEAILHAAAAGGR